MRIVAIVLTSACLCLFACQKERDFANRNSAGNTTSDGQLLVKTVQKEGSDSFVTTYAYDANKRLIGMTKKGPDGQGNDLNTQYHFHRNASGIVTDYSTTDPTLVAAGIDSIGTIVHYASSRYTSYVLTIDVQGFARLDSSALVYDGSGKVIHENIYESPSGTGADYYLSGKVDYSYAADGNLTGFVIHDLDQSGTEVFTASSFNFKYDSKLNPIQIKDEAIVLGHPEWISANNIVSQQGSDSNGPVDDQTITTTYTYNSANKPATSVITVMPDNTVVNMTYFYQ